jgi:mono/diheme cytochrome c family protein
MIRTTTILASIVLLAAGAPVLAADPPGKKVFDDVCMPCHGPSGEGIPNLAPSLKASAFVKSQDAKALSAFIRKGRDEKEKKYAEFASVMPPYNGSEEKADAVAAFIKSSIAK